nr:N-acetylmuramoyl-L-alanine amidase [Paenibacillus pini]
MFLLVFVVMFSSQHQVSAAASAKKIPIILDGKTLKVTGKAEVTNVNSSVMVPFRVVGENLGFDVKWDQKSQKVTLKKAGKTIELSVNKTTATVDGKKVTMLNPPLMKNESVIVPIRFVSEQMGIHVSYDGVNKAVYLTTTDEQTPVQDSDTSKGNGKTPIVPEPPTKTPSTTVPSITPPPTTGKPSTPDGNSSGGKTPTSGSTEPGEVIDPIPAAKGAQVSGISFSENRLMVAIDGDQTIKPNVFKMTNPDRIVVDLPKTVFSELFTSTQSLNAGNQGQLSVTDYPDVSNIRYSVFSNNPPTVRIVMDLNGPKAYSVYNGDSGSGLIIIDLNTSDNSPSVPVGNNGKKVVVIDAGHGNQDPGTIGVTGKKEKDFNLAMAQKVGQLLSNESGIDVVLTRSDDTFLKLEERAKIANSLNADVFISIHANSSTSSAASGSETYYQRDGSKALASVMHKYLVKSTGLSDRKVRYGNFHVIRETKMPAVLLEVGYLSNGKDESTLFTESVQDSVAQGIVSGIKEYLGIK